MTTLLVLVILAIGVVWLVRKKPREEVVHEQENLLSQDQPGAQQAMNSSSENVENEGEFIAVITAAIAEFTKLSSSEFTVLRIEQHSANWALTGRQNVMHNRL